MTQKSAAHDHKPDQPRVKSPEQMPVERETAVAAPHLAQTWQRARQKTGPITPAEAAVMQRTLGNQGMGQIMAKRSAPPVLTSQSSQNALALAIQRRTAYVGIPQAPVFDYDAATHKAGYRRVSSLRQNTSVDAADNPQYASEESDKQEYTKLNQPLDGVIKEENLRQTPKTRAGAWDVASATSGALGEGSGLFGLHAEALDRGPLREKDTHGYLVDKTGNTTTQDWQDKHQAEVVSGGYETVANIINIAATLRNWKKRNKEEKFSDAVDMVKMTASTGAAITKMIDSGAKTNVDTAGGIGNAVNVGEGGRSSVTEASGGYATTASDMAGKVTGNVADFVGLIQNTKDIFFKGKKLFETWKKHRDDQTASKGDILSAGVDLGISIVSAIKDVVSTARNLLFTLENAWHGGLATAVPGLGIAISSLKLLYSIWKVVKANNQRAKMRKLKQEWKEKLRDESAFDAFEKIDHKRIDERKKSLLKAVQTAQQQGFNPAGHLTKLRLIEEYELQKELQTVNRKRIDRQVIHISSAVMNISGDIATLSGMGAHAGVALKAASAATEIGAVGLRKVKQFGRDRAAKEDSWDVTKKVFNADKNSKAKLAQREKFADMIYDKIIALSEKASNFPNGQVPYDEPDFHLIRMYIRAVGLSWKAWLNQTSADPGDGHLAIVSGLAERE